MRIWGGVSACALIAAVAVVAPIFAVRTASAAELETPVIIQVPEGSTPELLRTLTSLRVAPDATFSQSIDGAAASLTPGEVSTILHRLPDASVQPDRLLHLTEVQTNPTWGLDTIDQASSTVDHSYSYPSSAGQGVDVFVIDTGLRASTYAPGGELFGRVPETHNLVSDRADSADARECLVGSNEITGQGGHGTHVAGTIASTTYGVAKKANIIPLRVFPCANSPSNGLASTSDVISAIELAVRIHQRRNLPGVINLSLGGDCDYAACINDPLIAAVNAATQPTQSSGRSFTGLTVTVAAGNGNTQHVGVDACGTSPAAAASVIAVGAANQSRAITSFSNWGRCVSLFAPGFQIRSLNAWYQVPNADPTNPYIDLDGTSMASPHVAGAAALFLGANGSATPAQVKAALTSNALTGVVTGLTGGKATSPNKFLSVSFLAIPPVLVSAPTNVTVSSVGADRVTVSWSPGAVSGASLTNSEVQYRLSSGTAWTTFVPTVLIGASTSTVVTGLQPGKTYDFRVRGISGRTLGNFSESVPASTRSGLATAPLSLNSASVAASTVRLTWQPPTSVEGSTVSDYVVHFKRSDAVVWTTYVDGVSTTLATTVSGLRASTSYDFRVLAKTPFGVDAGAPSLLTSATTLSGIPDAVTSLAPLMRSTASVGLSWSLPIALNGGIITDYVIYFRRAGNTTWAIYKDGATSRRSVTVARLVSKRTYDFKIVPKTLQGLGAAALISVRTR